MNKEILLTILNRIKNGEIQPEEAYNELAMLPYADLGFARIDHHRTLRSDFPEVVYCPGKTVEQICLIIQELVKYNSNLLATRAEKSVYLKVKELIPDISYHEQARLLYLQRANRKQPIGKAAVITGGTADLPIAEEAALCLETMGAEVERIFDVGVSGLHRLLDKVVLINEAQVLIVVAGMEGALPSVVGGLTRRPVIAVPTSIGYGASFNGLAALLAMLNSCASGVGVVNIDNGYGAAALAFSILAMIQG
ncbi:MAG: nickel pincer cofactor biosynthesis protein LarB [Syntrophomonadaceae bacterium]|nr:nickel pincer cofactor biosynthesis protein LarB [Syntrophomonadaceae bacterium]MDD3023509.1 nickel pincer cofactor biosynthesis protein LarB [Syntrophomonadaceae bacterium]